MRLLFAHDHRFRSAPDGRVWTTGAFAAPLWQRYLKRFDALYVLGRDGGPGDDVEGCARSDHPGVTFTSLESISGPAGLLRRSRVRARVEQCVSDTEAVVARLPSELGFEAIAAARKLGKPYLVEVVGSAFDAYHNHGSKIGKLYAPIADRRTREAVSRAALVVYVTREWLQTRYPTKNPEISPDEQAGRGRWSASGVTNAALILPGSSTRQRRDVLLEEVEKGRPLVLGTIGSLASKYKGVQFVLPALAALRNEGFSFTYRVLGGGDLAPWQSLIDRHGLSECCFLEGTLPAGQQVLDWLDRIDLYLQPSLTEGLPRSVLEAMSRGVPCIGSSAGGTPELIMPEYVHRPGDALQIESHLRTLFSRPNELRRLSKHSFGLIRQFSPEIVERKRDAMLSALREQCRGPGLVFAHDHIFRRGFAGEVWTSGAMPSATWQRFLDHFETVTVIGRDGGQARSDPGFARSDRPNVAFKLVPNINRPKEAWKRPLVRGDLESIVRASDAVAVRLPSELGLMAASIARKHGKTVLTEVAGSASISLRHYGSWITRLYGPVAERRTRRAVAASPFVTYVTRKWLQTLYPSGNPPAGVDPSCAQVGIVDVLVHRPSAETKAHRAEQLATFSAGRQPVFGTIATLRGRYKGLQFAIAAFAKLRAEGLGFTYRILGAGDPRPWQALIDRHGLTDCCFLDGVRPAGEPVLQWLDLIDVHLQPSLSESLGRGTIEALSRGVPCLASSAGGLSEYLDPEWLHPPGDVAALADDLRCLIQNPSAAMRMSQAAFEIATRFDAHELERARYRFIAQFAAAARRRSGAA